MSTHPSTIPFGSFVPDGDTCQRSQRLLARLHSGKFRPDRLWAHSADATWPGDMEGRTLLALTLLGRALGRTPELLTTHWASYPQHLNPLGYFGTIHGEVLDEQQLSSHGWVLRALCEGILADPARSSELRSHLGGIVDGLALPNADVHGTYPIDHRNDVSGGSHSGTAARRRGRWILSTDIGCDWIFMDGLVQAHELAPDPRLAAMIDTMIARFLEVDLVGLGMQTHATLTALRGCLRRARQTGDAGLLAAVRSRYATYLAHGMTANWANHNWFGRPRWTEPCAMVDAFQLALGLWQATLEPAYLADAHRCWHSGLGHGQRANGGFGPDTCCGADPAHGGSGEMLGMSVFEAHWCCSMRGGEGLARAIEAAWWQDGDDLWLCLPQSGTLRLADGLTVRLDTAWPHDGRLRLEILAPGASRQRTLRIFVPPGCSPASPTVDGQHIETATDAGFLTISRSWSLGETLELDLRPATRIEVAHGGGGRQIWHGPLLLSATPGAGLASDPAFTREGPGLWRTGDALLTPVDDMFHRSDLDPVYGEGWKSFRRRVIFA
jgi:uncharacterized protein